MYIYISYCSHSKHHNVRRGICCTRFELGIPVKACREQIKARRSQRLRCSRRRRNGVNHAVAKYAKANQAEAVSEATAQTTG